MTRFRSVLTKTILLAVAVGQAYAGIVLQWFPVSNYNANTAAMDATLGISGYTIDSFQGATLTPGLSITLSGGVPTTTWMSLPNLLSDNFCGALTSPAWAGSNVMTNQIANSFSNCTVPPGLATLTTFNYSPGTTSFGIGLGNFQSLNSPQFPITNHELFVNGVDQGTIENLDPTWTSGLGRNAYLVIDATGGSSITSVRFENIASAQSPSAQEDALEFDHLAISARSATVTPEPSALTLLGTGTLVIGCIWGRSVFKRL